MLNTHYQFVSILLRREGVKESTFLAFLNAKFKKSYKVLKDLSENDIQNVADCFDSYIELMHRTSLSFFTTK